MTAYSNQPMQPYSDHDALTASANKSGASRAKSAPRSAKRRDTKVKVKYVTPTKPEALEGRLKFEANRRAEDAAQARRSATAAAAPSKAKHVHAEGEHAPTKWESAVRNVKPVAGTNKQTRNAPRVKKARAELNTTPTFKTGGVGTSAAGIDSLQHGVATTPANESEKLSSPRGTNTNVSRAQWARAESKPLPTKDARYVPATKPGKDPEKPETW